VGVSGAPVLESEQKAEALDQRLNMSLAWRKKYQALDSTQT
jgi:hypothetical protein